jgi:hypothetical protein
MSDVKDLDSKILTVGKPVQGPIVKPDDVDVFVSGNFDVSARFNFKMRSPLTAIRVIFWSFLG